MSNKSNHTLSSKNVIQHTIPVRIDFIKDLLKDKDLQPMVNFDNTDTENFIQGTRDNDNFDDSSDSHDTRFILQKKDFNFNNIINQIGGRLEYIKSGTTGHTFKGIIINGGEEINYAVKVVAYPKKEKYGDIYNISRPENAELMMIKLLSYFVVKKRTPHIVLPIHTFYTSIKYFINLIKENVADAKDEKGNDSKYAEFVDKYQKGDFYSEVSILISEWANKGDFLDFMRKKYKRFTLKHWKVFFFQIISVLAVVQSKFPSFRHNDLKANNVLIHKTDAKVSTHKYTINGKIYHVDNIGYQLKLWDFDFACIPNIVDNSKVSSEWTQAINVTPHQNRYYDMHYFFNTLINKAFLPQIMSDSNVHPDVKNFINRIVPDKFKQGKNVHKRGRILVNEEYVTPDAVLSGDPFFAEFRNVSQHCVEGSGKSRVQPPQGGSRDKMPLRVSQIKQQNDNQHIKPQNIQASVKSTSRPQINSQKICGDANIKKKSRKYIENIKLDDLLND